MSVESALENFLRKTATKNAKNRTETMTQSVVLENSNESKNSSRNALRNILMNQGIDLSKQPVLVSSEDFEIQKHSSKATEVFQTISQKLQKHVYKSKEGQNQMNPHVNRIQYFNSMKEEVIQTCNKRIVTQIEEYNKVMKKENEVDRLLDLENDNAFKPEDNIIPKPLQELDSQNDEPPEEDDSRSEIENETEELVDSQDEDNSGLENTEDSKENNLELSSLDNEQNSSSPEIVENENIDEASKKNFDLPFDSVRYGEEPDLLDLCSGKFLSQTLSQQDPLLALKPDRSKKGRFNMNEFIEDEAEVSGSDIQSSDDEKSSDDEYDETLSKKFFAAPEELAQLPDEEILKNQIQAVHHIQARQDDEKQLNLLKNMYIPDGDLYDSIRDLQNGIGKRKRFRWASSHSDDNSRDSNWYFDVGNMSEDEYLDGNEDDEKQRENLVKDDHSLTPLDLIEQTLKNTCSKYYRSFSDTSSQSQQNPLEATTAPLVNPVSVIEDDDSRQLLKLIQDNSQHSRISTEEKLSNLASPPHSVETNVRGSFLRLHLAHQDGGIDVDESSQPFLPDTTSSRPSVFQVKSGSYSNHSVQKTVQENNQSATSFNHPDVKESILKILQKNK